MKKLSWLYETCAFLLALLFLYTAVDKLLDYRLFVHEISLQPFAKWFSNVLVVALPIVELLAVSLLLLPKFRVAGLALSFFLMTAFTIYVALVTFHFFKKVPCACAGVFRQMGWTEHLVFNILLTSVAAIALVIYYKIPHKKLPASQIPG